MGRTAICSPSAQICAVGARRGYRRRRLILLNGIPARAALAGLAVGARGLFDGSGRTLAEQIDFVRDIPRGVSKIQGIGGSMAAKLKNLIRDGITGRKSRLASSFCVRVACRLDSFENRARCGKDLASAILRIGVSP